MGPYIFDLYTPQCASTTASFQHSEVSQGIDCPGEDTLPHDATKEDAAADAEALAVDPMVASREQELQVVVEEVGEPAPLEQGPVDSSPAPPREPCWHSSVAAAAFAWDAVATVHPVVRPLAAHYSAVEPFEPLAVVA